MTQVVVPQLCTRHQAAVLRAMKLGPDDTWRAGVIIANILIFQWASNDDGVWARAEGEADNLSLVLAELGCLACAFPPGSVALVKVCRKGLDHAAAVSQGKAHDDDWPVPLSEKPRDPG